MRMYYTSTVNTREEEGRVIFPTCLRGDLLRGDLLRGDLVRGTLLRGDLLRGDLLVKVLDL